MHFRSSYTDLHCHGPGADDRGAAPLGELHHPRSHVGWAHRTWGGVPDHGCGPVDPATHDLGTPPVHPVDAHGVAGGLLGSDLHGITAVISGNVNNGGTQINIIEIDINTTGHALPPH